MSAWLRAVGLRWARSPGWQLVVGGAILALAFPSRLAGTAGLLIVAGALGVAALAAWPRLPAWLRSPPEDVTTTLVVALVVAFGAAAFWSTLMVSPDWQMGDWGPQRAVLARIIDGMPGLDAPVWNHAVGTGDAPLELYPKLAYLVTGHAAHALGLEDDLPRALMVVAVLVHLAIAVATTLLAMRVAPKPIALIVGLATVVDSGAVAHGGTVGLFRWALLHSALALAFATIAAVGILGALRRPRLGASVAIWAGTALACATHPAGLIAAAATLLGLAAVALLATDVPPRRALVAMLHVVLGVALGAAVWMPLAERILAYGQHFPNPVRDPASLVEDLLHAPSPVTAYAMLMYAGYFGILAGLWSRRAPAVFLAATALVLLVGLCDAPYLALDLVPGKTVARLGTERLAQLARPFVAAAGAYAIAIFAREAMRGWATAPPARKAIAAALAAMLAVGALRVLPSVWSSAVTRAVGETRVLAADPGGRRALVRWATEQAAALRPDAWARAVVETDTHEHFHLTAETGLPTFHLGPQPDLLLRERIEDLSAASLRRFNVRWAIASGRSPSLGDPATEREVGGFRIREIAGWDGQFARIERGTGSVRVLALDDTRVDIEVTATEPVLVALGTGYYPRWRARHASGAAERVYAMPSIDGGRLHVVSAWVAPGRTTFTVDGPLPSDGSGRAWSLLAALAMLAIVIAWRIPRLRVRLLRRAARARRRLPAIAPIAAQAGVPVLVIVLLAKGCADDAAPLRALELGTGLTPGATVQARFADEAWQTCDYSAVTAIYTCEGLLQAYDGIANVLNDAPPSWAFNTPGIFAYAFADGVELRVRVRGELAGTYWMGTRDGNPTLTVSGEAPRDAARAIVTYGGGGERTLELRASVPRSTWAFTFVREDTIIPPRPFLARPPELAPAAVRAIRARR